jgi:hypothetical protein
MSRRPGVSCLGLFDETPFSLAAALDAIAGFDMRRDAISALVAKRGLCLGEMPSKACARPSLTLAWDVENIRLTSLCAVFEYDRFGDFRVLPSEAGLKQTPEQLRRSRA